VLSAVAEVETAVAQLDAAERQLERLRSAEDAAVEAEDLATQLYEAGATDFLSVTDAVAQRLAIQRDRVRAQQRALVQTTNLYAALGGGWPADAIAARAD
jgi:outer membrane protein TolC